MATAESRNAIELRAFDGPRQLGDFLAVPHGIYANCRSWVPPLSFERRQHLDPRHNPYFAHARVKYWVAYRDTRPVGRISAQIDHAYLQHYDDATGHFGFLESEDDAELFGRLFEAAESWLKENGMRRVTGPFSLSINDESGLLVSGFETPPSLMMGHAHPYYGARVEEQGYRKVKDLIAYRYDLSLPMPPAVVRSAKKAADEHSLVLRPLDMSRYQAELATVIDIFNDAWSTNWGFVPMSNDEIDHIASELKPILLDDLVCIAEVNGETAAMAVSVPNVNEAMADLGGRLLPLGWAKLLWRLKVSGVGTARMLLMGVRKKFQGSLLGAVLSYAVVNAVREAALGRGFHEAELSWVLEDNLALCRLIEQIGGQAYKTYRLYEKPLA